APRAPWPGSGEAPPPLSAVDGAWAGRSGPWHLEEHSGLGAPGAPRHPRCPAGLAPGIDPAADTRMAYRRGRDRGPSPHRRRGPGAVRLRALPPRDERRLSTPRPARAVPRVRAPDRMSHRPAPDPPRHGPARRPAPLSDPAAIRDAAARRR